MGATRTAWHVLLAALLGERAPRRFEIRTEVHLSTEPLRADYLLLRAITEVDSAGQILRKLWGLLTKDTLLEFKSIGRPYRSRNLNRLWAYLHLYYAEETKRLERSSDLSGALLVPSRTRTLDDDVKTIGLEWRDLGDGYAELAGGPFALYVAEIDRVAEAEDDDLLRLFGHTGIHTREAQRWLGDQVESKGFAMEMHELEGYDEVLQKLIAALPAEQRLAGLAPEQRLAGLAPEQALLALPDEMLRRFPDTFLDTLSSPVRSVIRTRIGR